jgi:hypothetical protein
MQVANYLLKRNSPEKKTTTKKMMKRKVLMVKEGAKKMTNMEMKMAVEMMEVLKEEL